MTGRSTKVVCASVFGFVTVFVTGCGTGAARTNAEHLGASPATSSGRRSPLPRVAPNTGLSAPSTSVPDAAAVSFCSAIPQSLIIEELGAPPAGVPNNQQALCSQSTVPDTVSGEPSTGTTAYGSQTQWTYYPLGAENQITVTSFPRVINGNDTYEANQGYYRNHGAEPITVSGHDGLYVDNAEMIPMGMQVITIDFANGDGESTNPKSVETAIAAEVIKQVY